MTNHIIDQGTKVLEAAVNCLTGEGFDKLYVGPPSLVVGTCSELSVVLLATLAEYGTASNGRLTNQWQVTLSRCCGFWQIQEADELGVSLKVADTEDIAPVYADMTEDWWNVFSGIKGKLRLLCADNCNEVSVIAGNPPLVNGACITATVLISMPVGIDSSCC